MTERVTIGDVLGSVPDFVWDLPRAQLSSAISKAARWDPLLFAAWYLPHHLVDDKPDAPITFSRFHVDLARRAVHWAKPVTEPMAERHASIAPRESGKSTWLFLILPTWAAAYGHLHFVAAFADSGAQAEMHLATFRKELATNVILQQDFPRLCAPSRRHNIADSDTKSLLVTQSQFVFSARGIDAKSLGMKVGARRPDMILLDDVEPDGANYSAYQKGQRLATLQNSILPLAVNARVELSGTVTMPGSITHDLVRTVLQPDEPVADWVRDERFRVHHYDALVTDPDTGLRESLWPEKWSLEFLESIEHTRSYRLNYANDPMAADGAYWSSDDFTYGNTFIAARTILVLDPAVTTKEKSDFTGVAVVAGNRKLRKARILFAAQVKLAPGKPMRDYVLRTLAAYPEIGGVLIETNQGGDTWRAILHDLPVKLATHWSDEPKEIRAADTLAHYQRGRVEHVKPLPQAETQMVAFPNGAHDDIVDAIGAGVEYFVPKHVPGQLASSVQGY